MSTQLKNEVGSIAEAIMYFVRHYSQSDRNFNKWFKKLQHCLANFEYPNLAVRDCLDLKANFDLIIRDGDSQRYVTLKIKSFESFANKKSLLNSLSRMKKEQEKRFQEYSDVDIAYLLFYKSNKHISPDDIFVVISDSSYIVSHEKSHRYSYLCENSCIFNDADDILYNRSIIGDIWNENIGSVVRKK